MRRASGLFRLIIGAAALLSFATLPSKADEPLKTAPDGRALKLAFADEFDSFQRWNGRSGFWHTSYGATIQRGTQSRTLTNNAELQLYVDPDMSDSAGPLGLDPFAVRAGVLEITGTPTPPELSRRIGGYRFTSGVITTLPAFSQTYGYFEMRAELPDGKGLWPAFWLLPADQAWPPEIDVMECIGDSSHIYMTAHSGAQPQTQGFEARIARGEFHTFAIAWDANNLIWYIDGREAARGRTPADMHRPMYMLANLAIGGNWPGAPDESTRFPAKLRIDFIRAYRFAS